MSTTTSDLNSQSTAVPAVTVTARKTDEKDLLTGEDFRQEAQGNTSALAGNENPVRSETETEGA